MTFDINVTIRDTRCAAALASRIPITTGCRGEFRAVLHPDESWAGMDKTVVFRAGHIERSQYIGTGTDCLVPPEVLASTASALEIGVYGTIGGDVVRTTTFARVGGVLQGARPTDDPTESPDLYAQLLAEMASTVKTVNGQPPDENGNVTVEGGGGGAGTPGGYYTPTVTQPDENTLRMAFTPSKDDMPDVAHTDIMLPSGGGGTSDHSKLTNRDAAGQHPMSAITGLEAALDGKQPVGSYITNESDPTVPAWAKEPTKPSYTSSEVGADPSGTAASQVSAHNTGTDTHSDIRLLIQGLTDRLNALADSDDTTLDQLSEVVAYIKSNRDLISSITTDKVSVADIIDNLTTNVTNKPLSAAQGVALKALIDAITVPDKLPNPNALTFTGAVTGTYDGSAPVSVEIPSGGASGGGSAFSPHLIANLVADGTATSILQDIDVAYPAIYTVAIIGENIADTENSGQYLFAKFGSSDMYASAVDVRSIQTVNNNYTKQFVAVTFALDSEKCFHVIGKAENNAANTSNWMVTVDGSKILTNVIFFYSSTSKIIPAGFTCSVWRWA